MENSDILNFLKIELEDYKKDSHSKSMSEAETKDKDPGWRIWNPPKKVIDIFQKNEYSKKALYTIIFTLEYDEYQKKGNSRKINFIPKSMSDDEAKSEGKYIFNRRVRTNMISGYFFDITDNKKIGEDILTILTIHLGKNISAIYNKDTRSDLKNDIEEKVNINDENLNKVKKFLDEISETVKKIEELWREDMKNSEQEIKDKVKNAIEKHNQVIFTGAPGTGKTYTVKKKVQELIKEDNERVKFVQFHPSYDYTDFVEGLRPVILETGGEPTFVRLDGTFKEFCRTIVKNNIKDSKLPEDDKDKLIKNFLNSSEDDKNSLLKEKKFLAVINGEDEKKYYFIVDEINRADLSKVFGELMYCLEEGYRGFENRIDTQYKNLPTYTIGDNGIATPIEFDCFKYGFFIPKNLCFIGTMNSIDRSVESFDFALRRRFHWIDIKANAIMTNSLKSIGKDYRGEQEMKSRKQEIEELEKRINSMNSKISGDPGKNLGLTEDYHIGPAYFIDYFKQEKNPDEEQNQNEGKIDTNKLEEIFENRIEPLLRDYTRGRDSHNLIDKCRRALKSNTQEANENVETEES